MAPGQGTRGARVASGSPWGGIALCGAPRTLGAQPPSNPPSVVGFLQSPLARAAWPERAATTCGETFLAYLARPPPAT